MILIASGAYLTGEFAAEVGLLPPSFLPIGNKRLYEHQVAFLKGSCQANQFIYLSLPASFDLPIFDSFMLTQLKVNIIRVPEHLSLGESILYCWNAAARPFEKLNILHGDTLFLGKDFVNENAVSVHKNKGFYKRAFFDVFDEKVLIKDAFVSEEKNVISGFFSFNKPLLLMKALVESNCDFTGALQAYNQLNKLEFLEAGEWLDFGHINSFYQSRASMTTEREFNSLKISCLSVKKSSATKGKKIYAEGAWFEALPNSLKMYTPTLLSLLKGDISYNNSSYQLEYLYLLPFSDLYVFSNIPARAWKRIFKRLNMFLSDMWGQSLSSMQMNTFDERSLIKDSESLYELKTISRLAEYGIQTNLDMDSKKYGYEGCEQVTLVSVANAVSKNIRPATRDELSIVHGDLCFSNILYDQRVELVKCIDPRGLNNSGDISIFGDKRYDLAKLYHSVIGYYDFIISGRYCLLSDDLLCLKLDFPSIDKKFEEINEYFKDEIISKSGYSEKEILSICILLFLSMLPLHSDNSNRQIAFIANALRLYNELEKIN